MNALDTLAAVRAHLAGAVLDAVDQRERGELRAAIKLLDEAAAELAEPEEEPVALRDGEAVGEQLLALQAQVRAGGEGADELAGLYAALGRRARERARFQSVFANDAGRP